MSTRTSRGAPSTSTRTLRRRLADARDRLRLSGRPRRLVRATHVIASAAWTGLVLAMLVLGVGALTSGSSDADVYVPMDRIATAIAPAAITTLVTGLVLSLLTSWGLIRHWWVVVKAVIGLGVVLAGILITESLILRGLTTPSMPDLAVRLVAGSLAHTLLLAVAIVLSVDKPLGRTPWTR